MTLHPSADRHEDQVYNYLYLYIFSLNILHPKLPEKLLHVLIYVLCLNDVVLLWLNQ